MKSRPYNLVILSAEKAGATSERNLQAMLRLAGMLSLWGYDYGRADGQYEGRPEKSFAVKVYSPVDDVLPWLKQIAFNVFEQDAILLVDTQDQASLLYKEGHEKFLGIWTDVTGLTSQADYDKVGDYSKIGSRYFSIL